MASATTAKDQNQPEAIDQASSILDERITELEPLVGEYQRLVKARAALAGTAIEPAPKRRGRPRKNPEPTAVA